MSSCNDKLGRNRFTRKIQGKVPPPCRVPVLATKSSAMANTQAAMSRRLKLILTLAIKDPKCREDSHHWSKGVRVSSRMRPSLHSCILPKETHSRETVSSRPYSIHKAFSPQILIEMLLRIFLSILHVIITWLKTIKIATKMMRIRPLVKNCTSTTTMMKTRFPQAASIRSTTASRKESCL